MVLRSGPMIKTSGPLVWWSGPLVWRSGPLVWRSSPLIRTSGPLSENFEQHSQIPTRLPPDHFHTTPPENFVEHSQTTPRTLPDPYQTTFRTVQKLYTTFPDHSQNPTRLLPEHYQNTPSKLWATPLEHSQTTLRVLFNTPRVLLGSAVEQPNKTSPNLTEPWSLEHPELFKVLWLFASTGLGWGNRMK